MVLLGLPEPTAPLYHDVFPHGDEVTAEFPKWHSHPMGSRRKKKNVFPKVPMALEKQDLPAGRGDVVSAVARRQVAPKGGVTHRSLFGDSSGDSKPARISTFNLKVQGAGARGSASGGCVVRRAEGRSEGRGCLSVRLTTAWGERQS